MAGSGPPALSLGDVTSIRADVLRGGEQTRTHTKEPALKSREGACLLPLVYPYLPALGPWVCVNRHGGVGGCPRWPDGRAGAREHPLQSQDGKRMEVLVPYTCRSPVHT